MRKGIMKIKDEMVYGKMCHWDESSRSYKPYTFIQLTGRYFKTLRHITVLEKRIKGREATIEGLQRDIRRLSE